MTILNKKEEQIFELNSTIKCKLAPSKIHGIGVFAIMDIKKGQKLHCIPSFTPKWYKINYASLTGLLPEIRQLILERWPSIINGSHFLSPNDMGWLVTFINHSDTPNYDVDTDCALEDIKNGDEVTEDYRLMNRYEEIYQFLT